MSSNLFSSLNKWRNLIWYYPPPLQKSTVTCPLASHTCTLSLTCTQTPATVTQIFLVSSTEPKTSYSAWRGADVVNSPSPDNVCWHALTCRLYLSFFVNNLLPRRCGFVLKAGGVWQTENMQITLDLCIKFGLTFYLLWRLTSCAACSCVSRVLTPSLSWLTVYCREWLVFEFVYATLQHDIIQFP